MFIYRLLIVSIVLFFAQILIFEFFGRRKIEYKRYFDRDYVFEGEQVMMVEEIHNAKLLPLPWLRIESKINENLMFGSDSENLRVRYESLHESIFTLMPFTRITRKHNVFCNKRGEYILGSVYMSSGNLLGGANVSKMEMPSAAKLLVYPKISPISELPVRHHNILGDILMKRWILKDPFLKAGTNEYTYNEPLSLINWKATARAASLRVHNLDFSSEHKIMILMNVDLSEDQWTYPKEAEIVETLISIAASFAYKSLGMGIETGFATNACCYFNQEIPSIRPKAGSEQLHKILSTMCRIKLMRHLAFHTFLKNELDSGAKNHDYLILSMYESDEINKQLKQLGDKGNSYRLLTRKDLDILETYT